MLRGLINGSESLALDEGHALAIPEVKPPSIGEDSWRLLLRKEGPSGTSWQSRIPGMAGNPESDLNCSSTVDYCGFVWARHHLLVLAGNPRVLGIHLEDGRVLGTATLEFTESSLDCLRIVESKNHERILVMSTRKVVCLGPSFELQWTWHVTGLLSGRLEPLRGDKIAVWELVTYEASLPLREEKRVLSFISGPQLGVPTRGL